MAAKLETGESDLKVTHSHSLWGQQGGQAPSLAWGSGSSCLSPLRKSWSAPEAS